MLEELRRHREMVQGRIQKSFESDGLDLNILKAEETEIFKAQETEEQETSVTDLIKAGVLEYDDSIEKAVYADTPQNRKLGRVGQEYHRGKGKKTEESKEKKRGNGLGNWKSSSGTFNIDHADQLSNSWGVSIKMAYKMLDSWDEQFGGNIEWDENKKFTFKTDNGKSYTYDIDNEEWSVSKKTEESKKRR